MSFPHPPYLSGPGGSLTHEPIGRGHPGLKGSDFLFGASHIIFFGILTKCSNLCFFQQVLGLCFFFFFSAQCFAPGQKAIPSPKQHHSVGGVFLPNPLQGPEGVRSHLHLPLCRTVPLTCCTSVIATSPNTPHSSGRTFARTCNGLVTLFFSACVICIFFRIFMVGNNLLFVSAFCGKFVSTLGTPRFCGVQLLTR